MFVNQQKHFTRCYLSFSQHGNSRCRPPYSASTAMEQQILKSLRLLISLWQLLASTHLIWVSPHIHFVVEQLFQCTHWGHPCNVYSHGARGNHKTRFNHTSRIELGTLSLLLINYVSHGCCTNVSRHGHNQSLSTLLYLFTTTFNFIRNSLYVCNQLCVITGKIKMMQSSSFSGER